MTLMEASIAAARSGGHRPRPPGRRRALLRPNRLSPRAARSHHASRPGRPRSAAPPGARRRRLGGSRRGGEGRRVGRAARRPHFSQSIFQVAAGSQPRPAIGISRIAPSCGAVREGSLASIQRHCSPCVPRLRATRAGSRPAWRPPPGSPRDPAAPPQGAVRPRPRAAMPLQRRPPNGFSGTVQARARPRAAQPCAAATSETRRRQALASQRDRAGTRGHGRRAGAARGLAGLGHGAEARGLGAATGAGARRAAAASSRTNSRAPPSRRIGVGRQAASRSRCRPCARSAAGRATPPSTASRNPRPRSRGDGRAPAAHQQLQHLGSDPLARQLRAARRGRGSRRPGRPRRSARRRSGHGSGTSAGCADSPRRCAVGVADEAHPPRGEVVEPAGIVVHRAVARRPTAR